MSEYSQRLPIWHQGRGLDPLGWPTGTGPTLSSLEQTCQTAAESRIWLSGGEPTLRPDLPKVIETLGSIRPIGLDTDGLALTQTATLQTLKERGLQRVRIGLHSSQSDAHDWVVGLPGAAKRARRAIRCATEVGLTVHAQVVLTRPTTEHLPETVALLRRLGVEQIHLRRPILISSLQDRAVALSPRLGLLEPWLESAIQEARGIRLTIHEIPPCIAPNVSLSHFQIEPWLLPEAMSWEQPLPRTGCSDCPQDIRCSGGPSDYIKTFGRTELDSAGPLARDAIRVPKGTIEAATPPPARAGRMPATRLRQLHRQLALGRLYGDPLNGEDAPQPPQHVTVRIEGSSRSIRKELVRAAQQGAPELIIETVGDPPHPHLAELLQDTGRLKFERIVLRAPTTHLESLGEQRRIALRRITTIEESSER